MLNWLSSKLKPQKNDHPLATDSKIDTFLNDLSSVRPEAALHDVSDWLEEPQTLSDILPAEAVLHAITRLDTAGQTLADNLWGQFLLTNKIDHVGEQKLKSLDAFYAASSNANQYALNLLTQNPSARSNPLASSGLFAQRGLRALVSRARLQHARYRTPDAAWWAMVSEYLTLAKATGSLNLKQRCYPEDIAPSSAWIELLLGLFFTVSPLGNCNPQQMDLVFRILRWLEPHFSVSENFTTHSLFHVRLDQITSPKRAIGPLPADSNNVYFGPGLAYGHLIRLRSNIINSKAIPVWMEASHCDKEFAQGVIDSLIMYWSERPPTRNAKRQNREAKLKAIDGFTQIRRMIAFSEFTASGRKVAYLSDFEALKFTRYGFADATVIKDEESKSPWATASPLETLEMLETSGDKQLMDEWTLLDTSETGIGATSPFLKPWMIIGTYVGYRLTDEINWRIGILRRIHRKESGHPSLGIESLQEKALCAQVRALPVPPNWSPTAVLQGEKDGQNYDDAIIISQTKSYALIPKGLFNEGKFLALSIAGHREAVQMLALVHRNPDCDCIEFATLD